MDSDTISEYMKQEMNDCNEESDIALKNLDYDMLGDRTPPFSYNHEIENEVGKCWEAFKMENWKTAKRKKLDEKLIELVRAHPIIYDTGHLQYLDKESKEKAWATIGEKLNEPGSACKARWINIKELYQRSKKSKLTKSTYEGSKIKKPRSISTLCFLDDYLEDKNCLSVEEIPVQEGITQPELLIDDHEVRDDFCGQSEFQSPTNLSFLTDNKTDSKRYIKPQVKHRYDSSQEFNVLTIIKYLIDERRKRSQSQLVAVDPMDTFLSSISTTLKSFPPYYAHLAKGEIFNVVHKYEKQVIIEKNQQQERCRPSFISPTSSLINNKANSGSTALTCQSNLSYTTAVCPSIIVQNTQPSDILIPSSSLQTNIQSSLPQEFSKNEVDTRNRTRNMSPHFTLKTVEK